MAAFSYRAFDASGRSLSGVIEADNAAGARQGLRERKLLPVSVEATAAARAKAGSGAAAGTAPDADLAARPLGEIFRPAMSARMLTLVTRQLSTLMDSGIRVEDALRTAASQCRTPRAASVLLNLRSAILDGRTFAQALGDYPRIFSRFYRASVAAGEDSGRLSAVMLHLADFVETRQRNRGSVKLALIYPALLATVSLAISLLLMTYVVPDIARIFTSRGQELPTITRVMIGFSDLLTRWGWAMALGTVLLAVVTRRWLAVRRNRLAWHRLLATRRPTAAVTRSAGAAQFAGTLATLIQSGVALPDALDAAADVVSNLWLKARIEMLSSRVSDGASLQRAVDEADCFPPMLVAMIASGESSGRLGPALARASADQQRELDAWVATLVALVEPGVLILMGGFVMMLVLSILLPIVGVNDLAGSGL